MEDNYITRQLKTEQWLRFALPSGELAIVLFWEAKVDEVTRAIRAFPKSRNAISYIDWLQQQDQKSPVKISAQNLYSPLSSERKKSQPPEKPSPKIPITRASGTKRARSKESAAAVAERMDEESLRRSEGDYQIVAPKKQKSLGRKKSMARTERCRFGCYCQKSGACGYRHSKEEKTFFLNYEPKKQRKITRCSNGSECHFGIIACKFLHNGEAPLCMLCDKQVDHHGDCPKLKPKAGRYE